MATYFAAELQAASMLSEENAQQELSFLLPLVRAAESDVATTVSSQTFSQSQILVKKLFSTRANHTSATMHTRQRLRAPAGLFSQTASVSEALSGRMTGNHFNTLSSCHEVAICGHMA